MTYWGLNAIFLAGVAVIGVVALVLLRGRAPWASGGLAALVLLVLTAVFDNVMIGVGLVGYDPAKISGVFVGRAPLEDFAYAVAALVLLPSLWVVFGGGRREPR